MAGSGTPFVEGDAPSTADHAAFTAVTQAKVEPSPQQTPKAYAWYLLVGQFDPQIRAAWGAPQKSAAAKDGAAKQGQDGGAKKNKKDKKDEKGGDAAGGANARALAKQKRLEER